jgi:hypothetical protein
MQIDGLERGLFCLVNQSSGIILIQRDQTVFTQRDQTEIYNKNDNTSYTPDFALRRWGFRRTNFQPTTKAKSEN